MIEWKQLPRSKRYSYNGMTADVWPNMTTKKVYEYTVMDDATGQYLDCGMAITEDAACEKALASIGR